NFLFSSRRRHTRFSREWSSDVCSSDLVTGAQRDQRRIEIATLEFVERNAENHGTGSAERMAHRNAATVDVDAVVADAGQAHEAQNHGRKSFIDLEQIDVVDRHAGALEQFGGDLGRRGEHDGRLAADRGEGTNAAARLEAGSDAEFLVAEQYARSAVDDTAGVTAGMDVIERFNVRVFLQRDGGEAGVGETDERRLQIAERLHGGVGADEFVTVENDVAEDIAHRSDGFFEIPVFPRTGRAALALGRVAVDIVARETVERGDQIGANTLRQEVVVVGHGRVCRPGAAVGTHDSAGHRFNATADGGIGRADHDLRCRIVDSFERRGTEAVYLLAGDAFGVTRVQHGRAGDVAALLAHRLRTAEHYIVNQRSVQVAAPGQRVEDLRRQLGRADLVQRAIGPAATAGSAHMIVDESVRHNSIP